MGLRCVAGALAVGSGVLGQGRSKDWVGGTGEACALARTINGNSEVCVMM
jgi:hypothetical protein